MRIDDGFPTLVEFSESAVFGTLLWEKNVTPPGVQGGGSNETTTMRNTLWRTMAPKKLRTLSEMTVEMAYDPAVYDDFALADGLLQVNQEIILHWPDGSTLTFWGFVDEFTPNEVSEGEQPTADVTIIPSNQDADGEEIAPEYAAGS